MMCCGDVLVCDVVMYCGDGFGNGCGDVLVCVVVMIMFMLW